MSFFACVPLCVWVVTYVHITIYPVCILVPKGVIVSYQDMYFDDILAVHSRSGCAPICILTITETNI
eukprot:SAG11_NODE_1370_length_5096_cov_2.366620_3_plen_67_part_00